MVRRDISPCWPPSFVTFYEHVTGSRSNRQVSSGTVQLWTICRRCEDSKIWSTDFRFAMPASNFVWRLNPLFLVTIRCSIIVLSSFNSAKKVFSPAVLWERTALGKRLKYCPLPYNYLPSVHWVKVRVVKRDTLNKRRRITWGNRPGRVMGYFSPLNVLTFWKTKGVKPSFCIILSVIIAIAQIEHYFVRSWWLYGNHM